MRESLREALLLEDPGIGPVDMRTLVGVAVAIEHESVRRYAMLADAMERRGEPDTAAAFRTMYDEERRHVDAVARWADSLGEPLPAPEDFEGQLPAELSRSWNEVAGSSLLTPYRALSIAVVNEQRAFAFYSYLAAHAISERVRAEAERLASEELRHAARIRQWRREAWHRARRLSPQPAVEAITDLDALRRLLQGSDAAIARCHAAVARRLREIGDDVSAQIVERQLASAQETGPAGSAEATDAITAAAGDTAVAAGFDAAIAACGKPLPLLVIAQKPLEALAERLEAAMASAQGELFDEASQAMERLVERLTPIGSRAAHLQSGG